jgi:alkylhydroperoxidase family enzyme
LIEQVLNDHTTAPISERLRATLGLLKKMTLDHANLEPDDVRNLMRAGVSRQAIQDALEVAFLFNVYDRLADTMGWDVPPASGGYYQVAAKRLLERGYQ